MTLKRIFGQGVAAGLCVCVCFIVDVKTNWQQGFESFTREKTARKIFPDTDFIGGW